MHERSVRVQEVGDAAVVIRAPGKPDTRRLSPLSVSLSALFAIGCLAGFFPAMGVLTVGSNLVPSALMICALVISGVPQRITRHVRVLMGVVFVLLIGIINLRFGGETSGFSAGGLAMAAINGALMAVLAMGLDGARAGVVRRGLFLAAWIALITSFMGNADVTSGVVQQRSFEDLRLVGISGAAALNALALTVLMPFSVLPHWNVRARTLGLLSYGAVAMYLNVKAWSATGVFSLAVVIAIVAVGLVKESGSLTAKARRTILVMIFLAIGGGALVLAGPEQAVMKLLPTDDQDFSGRTDIWNLYGSVISQNPWLGSGTPVLPFGDGYANAHNTVLEILALGGVVQLAAVAVLVGVAFRAGRRDPTWIAAFAGLALFSLTNALFLIPLSWAILGSAFRSDASSTANGPHGVARAGRYSGDPTAPSTVAGDSS